MFLTSLGAELGDGTDARSLGGTHEPWQHCFSPSPTSESETHERNYGVSELC